MNKLVLSAITLAFFSTLGLSACSKKADQSKATPSPAPESLFTQKKLFQNIDPNETPYRMYRLVSENPTNVNFSPLSLDMAFGQVYLGSDGDSKALLEQIFGFKEGGFKFQSEFDLVKEIDHSKTANGPEVPQLLFANAVWVKADRLKTVLFAYKQDLSKYIDGTVNTLDVKKLNAWVSDATKGKIPTIIDQLDKNAISVFVNALYLKANWVHPFEHNMTRLEVFRSSPQLITKTDMMVQTNQFKYFENELGKFVALPYQGAPLEMILALPKKDGDLKSLEAKLDVALMTKVIAGLKEEKVDLMMPKFKFDTKLSLKKVFEDAGYAELFKPGNFTRFVNPAKDLKISDVIQATAIQVDEKGTEAAAATAVVMEKGAAFAIGGKSFKADQPFLFMIRNSKTGEIYFIGRMLDPR